MSSPRLELGMLQRVGEDGEHFRIGSVSDDSVPDTMPVKLDRALV